MHLRDGRSESFADYAAALRWLFEHVDLERTNRIREPEKAFRLDRTRAILKELGTTAEELGRLAGSS